MNKNIYPPEPILIASVSSDSLDFFERSLREIKFNNIIRSNDPDGILSILDAKNVEMIILETETLNIFKSQPYKSLSEKFPNIPIVLITKDYEVSKDKCIHKNITECLPVDVEKDRFVCLIKKMDEIEKLKKDNEFLKQQVLSNHFNKNQVFTEIITRNREMFEIFKFLEDFTPSIQPLLISGESGTGKESLARAYHKLSKRSGKFVVLDVLGFKDRKLITTLFGYKKNSFKKAIENHKGLFEETRNGTLVIKNISSLSKSSQIELFRVFNKGEYYPYGESEPKKIETSVIISSFRDLDSLQLKRKFNHNLYLAISKNHIKIPALRDRLDDLPILVDYFLNVASIAMKKEKPPFPLELITLLSTYYFPKNIEELQTMIFAAVSSHNAKTLSLKVFKKVLREKIKNRDNYIEYVHPSVQDLIYFTKELPTLKQTQRLLIKESLKRSKNNQSVAAIMLGVSRQALNQRLKTFKKK